MKTTITENRCLLMKYIRVSVSAKITPNCSLIHLTDIDQHKPNNRRKKP